MLLSLKNKNNAYKKVILLYGSTIIGLLFSMICSVVNTRALDPINYGNVRYIQNIIAFVSSLLLVGYFTSGSRLLALSRNEKESRTIRGAMCTILILTTIVLMIIMVAVGIVNFVNEEFQIANLAFISIPFCFNVLLLNYINTTAQGDSHIGRIAIARLFPSILYLLLAIPLFYFFNASSALMLTLYNGSAVIVLSIIIISTRPNFKQIKHSLKILHKENKQYGFNIYIGSIIGVSTGYIAGVMLGALGDNNANVAFYTLALTLATPLQMLPSIIGTTYFKDFATEKSINNKLIKGSILITIISCIIFMIMIKTIVSFLYPKAYEIVANYSIFLSIGMCAHGLGDLFNRFLGAQGQGKQIRNAAIACGLTLLIGSTVGIYIYGVNAAICTRIISSIVYFTVLIIYYFKFINKK